MLCTALNSLHDWNMRHYINESQNNVTCRLWTPTYRLCLSSLESEESWKGEQCSKERTPSFNYAWQLVLCDMQYSQVHLACSSLHWLSPSQKWDDNPRTTTWDNFHFSGPVLVLLFWQGIKIRSEWRRREPVKEEGATKYAFGSSEFSGFYFKFFFLLSPLY